MKNLLIIFFMGILLLSCTSQKKLMNSWIGNTKQSLILSWGPPARTVSDGGTGEICIYESTSMIYNIVRYNHRMFYVDKRGEIYSWRTESGPVPAQQMNVNVYIR